MSTSTGRRGSTPAFVAAALGFVVLAVAAVVLAVSAQVLDPLGPFPAGRSDVVLGTGSYLVYEVREPLDTEQPGRTLAPVEVLDEEGRALPDRDEEQVSALATRDWAKHVLVGEVDVTTLGRHVVVNGTAVPVALSPSRRPGPAGLALAGGLVLLVGGLVVLVRSVRDPDRPRTRRAA